MNEFTAPHNTPEARRESCGLPEWAKDWTFDTFTGQDKSARYALDWVRRWASHPAPAIKGVVLSGAPGVGKTGLMCAALRARAEAGDGLRGVWNLCTVEAGRIAASRGTRRSKPAPVWFTGWTTLRNQLEDAKYGRLPWDEDPPISFELLLQEIEVRTDLLGVDDIDVDRASPSKEEMWLRLLQRPWLGQKLLMTCNRPIRVDAAAIATFGERMLDRLLDTRMIAVLPIGGTTLRRPPPPLTPQDAG